MYEEPLLFLAFMGIGVGMRSLDWKALPPPIQSYSSMVLSAQPPLSGWAQCKPVPSVWGSRVRITSQSPGAYIAVL